MLQAALFPTLKTKFKDILDTNKLHNSYVQVSMSGVREGQVAGDINAPETLLVADFEGASGECSTSFPSTFKGSLAEVLEFDIENDEQKRGIFIAVLNAVMNKELLADNCSSCYEDDREHCAQRAVDHYYRTCGKVKTLLIGYQPYLAEALAKNFTLRILDLDAQHVGKTYHGVTVEHGIDDYNDAAWWADVILCTGSTLSNNTIVPIMNLPKDVRFYGTTIAGCARILGLTRLCPFSEN